MSGLAAPGPSLSRFQRANAPGLAYQHIPGHGALGVWLCGFKSDMAGTKAQWLAAQAKSAGRAFLRFDYRGCGASEGRFEEGTIGLWLQDTLAVLDHHAGPPLVLIGSSMGG